MDVAFEILIPSGTPLPDVSFQTPSFEWQGQSYPQGFPQFAFGMHFLLVETPIPRNLMDLLPSKARQVYWRCFSVKGPGLDLLQQSLNGKEIDWGGKGLPQLLDVLLGATEQWVVVFEMNADRIDKVFHGSIKDVLVQIESTLTDRNEGFLAISVNL